MAKRIDLPSNRRNNLECLEQKLVTNSHLVNYVFIVTSGFIIHAPSSIDEFELAISNKVSHLLLSLWSLLIPPSEKESNFNKNEVTCWILEQLINDTVNGELDSCILNIVFVSIVIFIYSFKPSNVIM